MTKLLILACFLITTEACFAASNFYMKEFTGHHVVTNKCCPKDDMVCNSLTSIDLNQQPDGSFLLNENDDQGKMLLSLVLKQDSNSAAQTSLSGGEDETHFYAVWTRYEKFPNGNSQHESIYIVIDSNFANKYINFTDTTTLHNASGDLEKRANYTLTR